MFLLFLVTFYSRPVITVIFDMMRLSTSAEEVKIRCYFAQLRSKQTNARILKFGRQVALSLSIRCKHCAEVEIWRNDWKSTVDSGGGRFRAEKSQPETDSALWLFVWLNLLYAGLKTSDYWYIFAIYYFFQVWKPPQLALLLIWWMFSFWEVENSVSNSIHSSYNSSG